MEDLVTHTELPANGPAAAAEGLFEGPRPEPHNFAECQRAMLPVHEVLAQISGKWTILVVRVLSDGPKRFSELKRQIDGVSQKMLTATLRDLEKDGFVSRKVTPSNSAARRLRTDRDGPGTAGAARRHRQLGARQSAPRRGCARALRRARGEGTRTGVVIRRALGNRSSRTHRSSAGWPNGSDQLHLFG